MLALPSRRVTAGGGGTASSRAWSHFASASAPAPNRSRVAYATPQLSHSCMTSMGVAPCLSACMGRTSGRATTATLRPTVQDCSYCYILPLPLPLCCSCSCSCFSCFSVLSAPALSATAPPAPPAPAPANGSAAAPAGVKGATRSIT